MPSLFSALGGTRSYERFQAHDARSNKKIHRMAVEEPEKRDTTSFLYSRSKDFSDIFP